MLKSEIIEKSLQARGDNTINNNSNSTTDKLVKRTQKRSNNNNNNNKIEKEYVNQTCFKHQEKIQ